ncbi:MAG TPA: hypothetical protein VNV82_19675 [Bryobacteraceae bacterium]|jgi:hypothetical protein|nr:hypothetical protein [Bryobacteraceae bacterium]
MTKKLEKTQPPNRTAAEIMDAIGIDPLAEMERLANGEMPCGICGGAGKTRYQKPVKGRPKERMCENCQGSGKETVSPALRDEMRAELKKYGLNV